MTHATKDLLISGSLILGGTIIVIASVKNHDSFFKSPKVRYTVWLFGREGARIIYAALGLVMIGFGALCFLTLLLQAC
jgi:hypothetical protein